jgi:OmcA/MtrC family decaheme c-type cytochrome
MLNLNFITRYKLHFSCSLLLTLLLFGCGGGSDGVQGPAGPVGSTGPVTQVPDPVYPDPTALVANFTSVTVEAGVVVTHFKIDDQDGHPYKALSGFRLTIAQLIPGENGNSTQWQSYINQLETAGAIGNGTEDKIQATYERDGTLVNHEDGSYSYTFINNLESITEPLGVTYDPTFTHRVAIQISGSGQPVANAVYDWQPSTGNTQNILTRKIVKTETCNNCHGELALHGSGRTEVDYCVTCHNGGSSDANSGQSIDFKQMIHKIHRGASLPSVVAGGEYAIWGFRNSKHDYSDVHFPQDIKNCTKCHDDADADTPDAMQWHQRPSLEACGSCHDDINFALGKDGGHEGGIQTSNDDCTVCHKEGGLVGSVIESHTIPSAIAALSFGYDIVAVTNTDSGQFPKITFKITDPQNQDSTYDIVNHPSFTAGGGASRIAIDLAWGTGRDYTNHGQANAVASAVSINALSGPQDNGDGSFTVTSGTAIPADASGTLAVAIEGHPAVDFDGDGTYSDRVPVTSIVEHFSINGADISPRRAVVDVNKCQNCHDQLSLHGGNRNGNVQQCVMCHNPNNTDISRRPDDPAQTADGKKEANIDFKSMIHSIHAGHMREKPAVYYGFGNSEHNFSHVRYPRPLNDCEACHTSGTYELPLDQNVLATTVDTGPILNSPIDDLNMTATAAVCSGCHDSPLSEAHMKQNGGASYATSQQNVDDYVVVETCQFCHGVGQSEAVKKVHGIK